MLPECAAVMLLGAAMGLAVKAWGSSAAELEILAFSPEVFFFGLLPPIVFDAGYTCRRKHFFQNFTAITLYAVTRARRPVKLSSCCLPRAFSPSNCARCVEVVGTFISAFLVAYVTFTAGKLGWVKIDVTTATESLLFGTLISAVGQRGSKRVASESEARGA